MTVGGTHPRTGRYFVGVFPYPGGYGAYEGGDGLVHGVTPQSISALHTLSPQGEPPVAGATPLPSFGALLHRMRHPQDGSRG